MVTTKNVDRKKLTGMMLQYVETKDKFPNDVVLFRVGDFFEAYFEDALPYSQICGITLTGKRLTDKDNKIKKEKNVYTGEEEKFTTEEILNNKMIIPMAGVPHKSLNYRAQQLIQAGKRVVVVEQMEDPKTVKGRLVKRDVICILSSMDKDGEYLSEYLNNWICSIYFERGIFSLCFTDISTSDIYYTNVYSLNSVLNEISRFKPSEIIVNSEIVELLGNKIEETLKLKIMLTIDDTLYKIRNFMDTITNSFDVDTIDDLDYDTAVDLKSLYIMIKYINYTKKIDFDFSKKPILYTYNNYMSIDLYSRLNLELTESLSDNTHKGSLLSVLNNCKTSMGSRLLKQWIDNPLLDKTNIEKRLDGVEELVVSKSKLENIHNSLMGILDISRIMGKLKLNKAIPRDLVNLRDSLDKLPEIKRYLNGFNSKILKQLYSDMGTFDSLLFLLKRALLDDPVSDIKDGLVLKSGYSKDLDTARDMIENSNKYLQELEEKERERTGIKNLKVVNKNGKCCIEVSKSSLDKVPDYYKIEKALKGGTRYVTDELETLEKDLFSAIERSKAIEIELYDELKKVVLLEHRSISVLCDVLSTFDVLCSFAQSAIKYDYVRPSLNVDGRINIVNGRHPVVENLQKSFVSNDTLMDMQNNRFLLITGPNMAGKSTYMRQIALITIMSHIGSFVPAESADISLTDKIFTRIGASDDISSGRSTYMVEMVEVKNILENATKKSLVLLDEVGRGTSTSDGLSIAQAVSEYIFNEIGCKTLFATHYHELIHLEKSLKGFKNYHMAVNKENGTLDFIRKLEVGGLSESYGIDVAQLAGLPVSVIERARDILNEIEKENNYVVEVEKVSTESEIIKKLKEIDKSELSLSEAFYILHTLIDML